MSWNFILPGIYTFIFVVTVYVHKAFNKGKSKIKYSLQL